MYNNLSTFCQPWIGRLTTDRWALKGPEMKVQPLPDPPYRMPIVITFILKQKITINFLSVIPRE
jgi:hypothetical protein